MANKHVIPIDDLKEHTVSADCFCEPRIDAKDRFVVIHNAADGREYKERESGQGIEGKPWGVFEETESS